MDAGPATGPNWTVALFAWAIIAFAGAILAPMFDISPMRMLVVILLAGVALTGLRWVARSMSPAASAIGVVLVAAAIGAGAYAVTSWHAPLYILGGPVVEMVEGDGYDIWTGEPHGRIYWGPSVGGPSGTVDNPPRRLVRERAPHPLWGHRAIPIWVGFGVAVLIGGSVVAADRRRGRRGAAS